MSCRGCGELLTSGEIENGREYCAECWPKEEEKTFRSLKRLREEYFPKAVAKEKMKEETPEEAGARIFKDIITEV